MGKNTNGATSQRRKEYFLLRVISETHLMKQNKQKWFLSLISSISVFIPNDTQFELFQKKCHITESAFKRIILIALFMILMNMLWSSTLLRFLKLCLIFVMNEKKTLFTHIVLMKFENYCLWITHLLIGDKLELLATLKSPSVNTSVKVSLLNVNRWECHDNQFTTEE